MGQVLPGAIRWLLREEHDGSHVSMEKGVDPLHALPVDLDPHSVFEENLESFHCSRPPALPCTTMPKSPLSNSRTSKYSVYVQQIREVRNFSPLRL